MIQHPSVLSPLLRQMLSPVEADHLVLPPSSAGTEAHGLQWLSGSLCEAAPAAWSQQGRQQPRGLHLLRELAGMEDTACGLGKHPHVPASEGVVSFLL